MDGSRLPRRLVLYYLCALIVVAPLPLGAHRDWAGYLLLTSTLVVTGLVCLDLALSRRVSPPSRGAILCFLPLLAWLGLILAQVVNGQVLVAEWLVRVEPHQLSRAPLEMPPWLPLSIDPAATTYQLKLGILYLLVLALTIHAVRTPRHARMLLYAILASAGVQAAIGFYEQIHQFDLFGIRERLSAINGTFVNRNHFAGFVACGAAIAIAIVARRLTIQRDYVPSRAKNLLLRWIDVFMGPSAGYLIVIAIALFAIASSGSRGATFALAGAAVIGLLWLTFGLRKSRHFVWGIYLAVITIVAAAAVYDTLVLARAVEMLDEPTMEARMPIWQQVIRVAELRPMTGFGLGTFTDALAPHRDGSLGSYTYDYAHSHYLELALETGLAGLLLLGIFCAMVLKAAATVTFSSSRSRAEAGFAALLVFLVLLLHALVEFNLTIPAIAILLHIAAGILISLANPSRDKRAGGAREDSDSWTTAPLRPPR